MAPRNLIPAIILCLAVLTASTLCVDEGTRSGEGEPVEGVTLVFDFGDSKGPVHPWNLTVWDLAGGGGDGEGDPAPAPVTVENGHRTVHVFKSMSSEDGTVLGLMEAALEAAGYSLTTSSYSHGEFVESVGGVKCDKDGDNWLFWVNGIYGTLAADRTQVDDGDVVFWRYMDPARVDGDSGKLSEIGLDLAEVRR